MRSVIEQALRGSCSIYGDIDSAANAADAELRKLISAHMYDVLRLCRSERETQLVMDLCDRIGRPSGISASPP